MIRPGLAKQVARAIISVSSSLSSALALFVWTAAYASAAPADMFIHVAESGDTLGRLAANYLGDADLWPLLGRINHIDNPRGIAIGSPIQIPVSDMRRQPERVRVLRVDGIVSVVRANSDLSLPLATDQLLYEGDALRVGAHGFVSIALGDGSILHVQADTVLHIGTLSTLSATGASRSIFRLDKGRVDAVVKPVSSAGGRFEVATPLAVAGVRGTNFGVGVRADGSSLVDVMSGTVAFGPEGAEESVQVTSQMGAVVSRAGAAAELRPAGPAPSLDGLTHQIERVEFSLPIGAAAEAGELRVQVSRDRGMRDVVSSRISVGPVVRLSGIEDGNYFLGVQVAAADGNMSRQSVAAVRLWLSPRPPEPLAPAAHAEVSAAEITLECSTVDAATVYDIELSDGPRFDHVVARSVGNGDCRWKVPLLSAGRYYWRATTVVRRVNGDMVRGPRGDVRDFVVTDR